MAVTPGRAVWLEVDGPEYSTVLRPTYRQSWRAPDIGKADGWVAKVNADGSIVTVEGHRDTMLVPGEAWALAPIAQMKYALMTEAGAGGLIPPGGFTVAPTIKSQPIARPPTDLTGVIVVEPPEEAIYIEGFVPALRRRIPAGMDWDDPANMLGVDQGDYPPPVDIHYPDLIPVDRVAVSTDTYEPNMGFGFTFGVPNDYWGSPTLFKFYFGGPATMQPLGAHGGEFCLVVQGNGNAVLYERDQTTAVPPALPEWTWVRRDAFSWAESNSVVGGSHTMLIWPMATDRILFQTRVTAQPAGPQGQVMPPVAIGHYSNPTMHLYRDTPGQTGHLHMSSMTGAGPTRIDLLRNYRMPIIPWLMQFPPLGWVIDQPFAIPQAVEAGMPIEVRVTRFRLSDAEVQVQLYNADTGAALALDPSFHFLAHAGQQKYFARFNFTSSANGFQTPILFDYAVGVAPAIVVRTKTPVSGKVRDGSVTGPDLMPGHGSANVNIRDIRGTFPILRAHDRRYCRVKVTVPATGPSADPRGFVIIHEGETWQPKAQLRGREGLGNKQWWNYHANMIDMWYRIQKQLTYQLMDYYHDPSGPTLADGKKPPWVIMAVIRDLFNLAGVPYDEIDAPGWDDPSGLRFWYSPHLNPDDYQVQPGVDIALLIKRIAFDTLGKVVVRDPNAYQGDNTNRGLWRVLSPPAGEVDGDGVTQYPLSASKAAFFVRRNTAIPPPPHVVEEEGGMGIDPTGVQVLSFVKDESYFVYPQAPEATYLGIWGKADLQAKGQGNQSTFAFLWNPKAVDFSSSVATADPASISYMDRWEPILINDPTVVTPEGVNYMAARIARQALNGRLWCEFVAPLVFVKDPADDLLGERRRPLRVYDQVTVCDENGDPHPVMLRNVNPFWRGAADMWAYHQGLFLDAR